MSKDRTTVWTATNNKTGKRARSRSGKQVFMTLTSCKLGVNTLIPFRDMIGTKEWQKGFTFHEHSLEPIEAKPKFSQELFSGEYCTESLNDIERDLSESFGTLEGSTKDKDGMDIGVFEFKVIYKEM